MKAEIKVVLLNADVITASGGCAEDCPCYDPTSMDIPCPYDE